jgi:hypothetical protein
MAKGMGARLAKHNWNKVTATPHEIKSCEIVNKMAIDMNNHVQALIDTGIIPDANKRKIRIIRNNEVIKTLHVK